MSSETGTPIDGSGLVDSMSAGPFCLIQSPNDRVRMQCPASWTQHNKTEA